MNVRIWLESNLLIAASLSDGQEFAFYLFKDGDVIEKTSYSANQAHAFRLHQEGTYQVKAFCRSSAGEKLRAWSEEAVFNRNSEDLSTSSSIPSAKSPVVNDNTLPCKAVQAEGAEAPDSDPDVSFLNLEANKEEIINSLLGLTSNGHRPTQWVVALEKGPTPPPTGWFNSGKIRGTSEEILRDGWRFPKHEPIKFDRAIDWAKPGKTNRTWGYELHAWRFIDPVLSDYFESRDESLLRWMLEVVRSWWSFAEKDEDHGSMAWYDMAVSLRMPRLARLIIATAQSELRDQTINLFYPALAHISAAMQPSIFHPQNNHGFYAAAAALDFSKWLPFLTGTEELHCIGEDRMAVMVERQFAPDGGHLEHSPDYHRMLLGSFEIAIRDGLIKDAKVVERIEKAVEALGWMVQPDGKLVQFGDSPSFQMGGPGRKSSSPRTEFILTDGARGEPNSQEMLVLPDSGYAFVRAPQPTEPKSNLESSYLAFQAGFHSRAHKHADDLTFTWFDHGQEIVVDSGRYGYVDLLPSDAPDRLKGFFYAAPERQYVETTRAHNTVEVNGNDIERRDRTPYGSALGSCTKVDGTFVIRGEVDHGTYLHQRMLRMTPGEELEVIDTVTPAGAPVDAISWFNLDGSLDLYSEGDVIQAKLPNTEKNLQISGQGDLIAPVKGQPEPLRGWRSRVDRELEPVWNFGYRMQIEKRTRFKTTFSFESL